jgi:hypothetical protein
MAQIENTNFPKKVRRMLGLALDSWNNLMVLSLGLGAIAAVIVGISTYAVIKLQRAEAEDASAAFEQYKLGVSAQAETAKSEIAKANARTAEAELRIKRLEPRNLNWSAFVDALHEAPQSKVEIVYFADDFDSMALAQQIALAIKAAGWEEPFRGPIKKPADWSEPTPMAVDGQPTGVTIVARLGSEREAIMSGNMLPSDAEPSTPFTAMRHAIMLGTGRVATWTNGPHAPPYGTLRIVVAPRE